MHCSANNNKRQLDYVSKLKSFQREFSVIAAIKKNKLVDLEKAPAEITEENKACKKNIKWLFYKYYVPKLLNLKQTQLPPITCLFHIEITQIIKIF